MIDLMILQPHGAAIRPTRWDMRVPAGAVPRVGESIDLDDGAAGGTVTRVEWEHLTDPDAENPVRAHITITEE